MNEEEQLLKLLEEFQKKIKEELASHSNYDYLDTLMDSDSVMFEFEQGNYLTSYEYKGVNQ